MKNVLNVMLFIFLTLSYACNNAGEESSEESNEETTEEVTETETVEEEAVMEYTLSPENTELQFTAYKTTEKKPVKGVFKTLDFEGKTATDLEDLLDSLSFSIPVSSLFTNDATGTRDPKILEFFFGVMSNTEMLSGTIYAVNGEYKVEVTMNDATSTVPLMVNVSEDNVLTATTSLDLNNWNALEALASLNKVCFELHKGSDGVSKTWEDVAVEITAQL